MCPRKRVNSSHAIVQYRELISLYIRFNCFADVLIYRVAHTEKISNIFIKQSFVDFTIIFFH